MKTIANKTAAARAAQTVSHAFNLALLRANQPQVGRGNLIRVAAIAHDRGDYKIDGELVRGSTQLQNASPGLYVNRDVRQQATLFTFFLYHDGRVTFFATIRMNEVADEPRILASLFDQKMGNFMSRADVRFYVAIERQVH
jgi:hypothetical protein